MSITVHERSKFLMDRRVGEEPVSGKIGSKTFITAIDKKDLANDDYS